MMAYMLDTNAFDRVADGGIPADALAGRKLFVTHVQRDELCAITHEAKRARLLALFDEIGAELVPTSSTIIGDSRIGLTLIGADDGVYLEILARLKELDKPTKKRRGYNQSRDVRIAETALRRGYTLVTGDGNLATVMRKSGGRAIRPDELDAEPR